MLFKYNFSSLPALRDYGGIRVDPVQERICDFIYFL